jgi:hypothetical protein
MKASGSCRPRFADQRPLESHMTQPQAIRQDVFQDIRRRPDGSIDIDFYRADAIVLRNRAIRDTFRLMALATVRVPFKQWRMCLVLLANGR